MIVRRMVNYIEAQPLCGPVKEGDAVNRLLHGYLEEAVRDTSVGLGERGISDTHPRLYDGWFGVHFQRIAARSRFVRYAEDMENAIADYNQCFQYAEEKGFRGRMPFPDVEKPPTYLYMAEIRAIAGCLPRQIRAKSLYSEIEGFDAGIDVLMKSTRAAIARQQMYDAEAIVRNLSRAHTMAGRHYSVSQSRQHLLEYAEISRLYIGFSRDNLHRDVSNRVEFMRQRLNIGLGTSKVRRGRGRPRAIA